jgi:hypothetical protein
VISACESTVAVTSQCKAAGRSKARLAVLADDRNSLPCVLARGKARRKALCRIPEWTRVVEVPPVAAKAKPEIIMTRKTVGCRDRRQHQRDIVADAASGVFVCSQRPKPIAPVEISPESASPASAPPSRHHSRNHTAMAKAATCLRNARHYRKGHG